MRYRLVLFACLVGCRSEVTLTGSSTDLSIASDSSTPPDATSGACTLASGNAAVFVSADAQLTYGWLGNIDAGSEVNCGGNPEAIRVWLSSSSTPNASGAFEMSFTMKLPVTLGTQSVAITPVGGGAEVMGMVNITSRTTTAGGPGLDSLEGVLDSGVGQGHFSVSHCKQLDVMCI